MNCTEVYPGSAVPCTDVFLMTLAVVTVMKGCGWDADDSQGHFLSVFPWLLIMQSCALEAAGLTPAA